MKTTKKLFLLFALICSFAVCSYTHASETLDYDLVSWVFRICRTCSIDVVSGDDVHHTVEKLSSKELTAIDMLCNAFDSVEYKAKNTSDKEYICDVYYAVFSRQPSATYINEILAFMKNWSRETTLKEIVLGPEFYNLCQSYDIHMIKDIDHPVMQYAKEIMDELNWDLKAAFDWSHTEIYYDWPYSPGYNDSHLEFYARFGFENGYGNCYVMSSVFCWMARLKGLEIYTVEGYVPLEGGSLAEHGWCEAVIDGKTYVFDSSWSRHGNDGYMIQYKQKGTYVYTDYKRVY